MKAAKALGGLGRKAVPTRNKQKFGPSESLSFEDLLRKATAKTLPRPDPETNQQVTDAVKDGLGNSTLSLQHLDHLLYERLTLNNPHKVWLSIELIRKVVDDALQERSQALQQVLSELNSIASRPMNRYASDLPAQQQVKSGAYSLLRHLAGETGDKEPTSPRSSYNTPSPRRQADRPHDMNNAEIREANWPKLKSALEHQMMLCTSNLEQVQDMVVQISGGGNVQFQRSHLEELVRDLEAMRAKFEPLLSRLSSYQTDEATALMSRALEMMDTITNTSKLKDEVLSAKASANSSPAPALQYAPRAGTGGPSTAPAAKPSNISNALDGIAELQQAFATGPPAAGQASTAPRDPFALPGEGPSIGTDTPRSGGQGGVNPFKPAPYNPMQGGGGIPQQQQQNTGSSYQDPFGGSSTFGAPSGASQTFPQGSQQQQNFSTPSSSYQQPGPSSGGYNPFAEDAPTGPPPSQQPSQSPADPFSQLFGSGGPGQRPGPPSSQPQQHQQQQYGAQQPQQYPAEQPGQYSSGQQQYSRPAAPPSPFGNSPFGEQSQQQPQSHPQQQQQPTQAPSGTQDHAPQQQYAQQQQQQYPNAYGGQQYGQQYGQPGPSGAANQTGQAGFGSSQQPQQAQQGASHSNPFASSDDAFGRMDLGPSQGAGQQSQPFGGAPFPGAGAGSQQPARAAETDPFDTLFNVR